MAPSNRSPHPAESQASLARPSPGETQLPGTCVVPWTQGFRLGYGVNAVTGALMRQALQTFTPDSGASAKIEAYIRLCENTDSVRKTFARSTAASGSLNFEPLDLQNSLMTSALRHVEHSSTSFSLLVRWRLIQGMETAVDPKEGYRLLPEAAGELAKGADNFRRAYGDYFVANVGRSSQFDAVLTFRCSDARQREEVVASIRSSGALTSGALPVEGSTDVQHSLSKMSKAFSKSVSVSMDVCMHGVSVDKSAPQGLLQQPNHYDDLKDATPVLRCFEWFATHCEPSPVSAELRPFFLITDAAALKIPHSIPVSLEVFCELDEIRQQILECSTESTALRTLGKAPSQLQHRLGQLVREGTSLQQELVINHGERKRLLQGVCKLREDYTRFLAAWSLLHELLPLRAIEPTGPQPATKAGERWAFGRKATATSPIAIALKKFQPVHVQKTVWNHRGALAHVRSNFTVDSMALLEDEKMRSPSCGDTLSGYERVVGWSVTSLNGHGEWEIERGGIGSRLSEAELSFSFSSGRTRSGEWQVTVYVVRDDFFDIFVSMLSMKITSPNFGN
ncbi:hypothetical protein EXIGLDRAFT_736335 [Exidia glandulosa HHB12029]|uniref:Uncharacterized protein n=1 Tax=Exidia glandulosa HHB12029 TaxID=1314781 RepID=A0A166N8F8_EXIGL|nr:hypothetical protein EXIGLDRAFT_736335 [Exidia glandulosa HHB12029]